MCTFRFGLVVVVTSFESRLYLLGAFEAVPTGIVNVSGEIESKIIVPDISFHGVRPYFGETIFIHPIMVDFDWMIVFLNSNRMKSKSIPVSLSGYS